MRLCPHFERKLRLEALLERNEEVHGTKSREIMTKYILSKRSITSPTMVVKVFYFIYSTYIVVIQFFQLFRRVSAGHSVSLAKKLYETYKVAHFAAQV